eukprot:GHRQ01032064.1.p1 GENE.GHRQ01032064.1~~GHRQ01032064.1.p1  ORF type:complete len:145 (+),score=23.92 GHRQ01032064.1:655-1089(+)
MRLSQQRGERAEGWGGRTSAATLRGLFQTARQSHCGHVNVIVSATELTPMFAYHLSTAMSVCEPRCVHVRCSCRDTFVHIMEQYAPRHLVGSGEQRSRQGWTSYNEINRPVRSDEVQQLRDYARSIGLWRFEEAPRYEAGEMAG